MSSLTGVDFLYYVDNGLYDHQGVFVVFVPGPTYVDNGMEIIQGGFLGLELFPVPVGHENDRNEWPFRYKQRCLYDP